MTYLSKQNQSEVIISIVNQSTYAVFTIHYFCWTGALQSLLHPTVKHGSPDNKSKTHSVMLKECESCITSGRNTRQQSSLSSNCLRWNTCVYRHWKSHLIPWAQVTALRPLCNTVTRQQAYPDLPSTGSIFELVTCQSRTYPDSN